MKIFGILGIVFSLILNFSSANSQTNESIFSIEGLNLNNENNFNIGNGGNNNGGNGNNSNITGEKKIIEGDGNGNNGKQMSLSDYPEGIQKIYLEQLQEILKTSTFQKQQIEILYVKDFTGNGLQEIIVKKDGYFKLIEFVDGVYFKITKSFCSLTSTVFSKLVSGRGNLKFLTQRDGGSYTNGWFSFNNEYGLLENNGKNTFFCFGGTYFKNQSFFIYPTESNRTNYVNDSDLINYECNKEGIETIHGSGYKMFLGNKFSFFINNQLELFGENNIRKSNRHEITNNGNCKSNGFILPQLTQNKHITLPIDNSIEGINFQKSSYFQIGTKKYSYTGSDEIYKFTGNIGNDNILNINSNKFFNGNEEYKNIKNGDGSIISSNQDQIIETLNSNGTKNYTIIQDDNGTQNILLSIEQMNGYEAKDLDNDGKKEIFFFEFYEKDGLKYRKYQGYTYKDGTYNQMFSGINSLFSGFFHFNSDNIEDMGFQEIDGKFHLYSFDGNTISEVNTVNGDEILLEDLNGDGNKDIISKTKIKGSNGIFFINVHLFENGNFIKKTNGNGIIGNGVSYYNGFIGFEINGKYKVYYFNIQNGFIEKVENIVVNNFSSKDIGTSNQIILIRSNKNKLYFLKKENGQIISNILYNISFNHQNFDKISGGNESNISKIKSNEYYFENIESNTNINSKLEKLIYKKYNSFGSKSVIYLNGNFGVFNGGIQKIDLPDRFNFYLLKITNGYKVMIFKMNKNNHQIEKINSYITCKNNIKNSNYFNELCSIGNRVGFDVNITKKVYFDNISDNRSSKIIQVFVNQNKKFDIGTIEKAGRMGKTEDILPILKEFFSGGYTYCSLEGSYVVNNGNGREYSRNVEYNNINFCFIGIKDGKKMISGDRRDCSINDLNRAREELKSTSSDFGIKCRIGIDTFSEDQVFDYILN